MSVTRSSIECLRLLLLLLLLLFLMLLFASYWCYCYCYYWWLFVFRCCLLFSSMYCLSCALFDVGKNRGNDDGCSSCLRSIHRKRYIYTNSAPNSRYMSVCETANTCVCMCLLEPRSRFIYNCVYEEYL